MYDARTRDRFRLVVTGATGLVAVASATAVGALTGLAARDAVPQASTPPVPGDGVAANATREKPPVRWKQRPRRTVVSTTVVQRQVSTPPLGGGTVSAPAPAPAPPPAPLGGAGAAPAKNPPPPPAPPPPPPPPPPPAPSSGS